MIVYRKLKRKIMDINDCLLQTVYRKLKRKTMNIDDCLLQIKTQDYG